MTDYTWAAVALVALLLAIGAEWWRRRSMRRSGVNDRLRHRLIVTLKSGDAFDGVLWEADARVWVLRQTNAHGAGERGEDLPVDGEVLLMVADIAFAQKP